MKAPTKIKNMNASRILSLMQFDKKRKEGITSFIVPKKVGETLIIKDVNKKYILKSLKEISHG